MPLRVFENDDVLAMFRFVAVLLAIALILAAVVFIARNVAPLIFLLADRRLADAMFGGLGAILAAGTILTIAQIVALFMHLRRR